MAQLPTLLRRFITYPSPLGFSFFLPIFQNSELRRPFVKQHMKIPSWFSAALGPLTSATGILLLQMRASEAVRASTSRSLTLMFPNLTVTIPPKTHIFAGPSLSRTLKHGVGSLSSCYKRLFFGMEVVQVLVAPLRLPLCCFVGEESFEGAPTGRQATWLYGVGHFWDGCGS